MNCRIFLEDEEITDEKIMNKLILCGNFLYKIPIHIEYVLKIKKLSELSYLFEYYLNGKLLNNNSIIGRKNIQPIIRENFLNKILNE